MFALGADDADLGGAQSQPKDEKIKRRQTPGIYCSGRVGDVGAVASAGRVCALGAAAAVAGVSGIRDVGGGGGGREGIEGEANVLEKMFEAGKLPSVRVS